tara:strand:- start:2251 stop:3135 length:885 start_codon:yes stop_codon:yes gene_type:complete
MNRNEKNEKKLELNFKDDDEKVKQEEVFNKFNTPVVLPVREEPPDMRILPLHPNIPSIPSLILCIAGYNSGKTTLINSMLLQSRENGWYGAQDLFDEVIIMSNTINNDPTARFLKKAFTVTDGYSDGMISELYQRQKSFGEKKNAPFIALFADDILGRNLKRNSELSFFATRFRHANCGLLAIFTQNFKSVDTILRNNSSDIIIFKQTNKRQLEQIEEEYGGVYEGMFMELYKIATAKKYNFLYLRMKTGEAFRNFEEKIGEYGNILSSLRVDDKDGLPKTSTEIPDIPDENKI